MAEFIVSWSPYGPSGRIQAEDGAAAAMQVVQGLQQLGLQCEVFTPLDAQASDWQGRWITICSPVKRYGDSSSFGICVYAPGQISFYDRRREYLEAQQDLAMASKVTS